MTSTGQLTKRQQSNMSMVLHLALKEIRLLSWEQQWEQAADLADALVQMPLQIFSPDFDHHYHKEILKKYQEKYPQRLGVDFVKYLDHV